MRYGLIAGRKPTVLAITMSCALGSGFWGCQAMQNVPLPPDDGMVSYATHIQPIFDTHCSGCHSPGGIADLAGIELQLTADVSYDLLVGRFSVQDPGLAFVVAGDAAGSLLFQKISSDSPPVGVRMPRFAPPLSATEIDLVRDWIDQGAMNN